MLNAKLFFEAIDALEQQGINREITIQALKDAFETIVKKKHIDGLPDLMVKVDIDTENGKINIYNIKNVVEDVQDDALEISLEDAQETNPDIKIGDQVYIEVKLEEFTKADAIKLKQKIKEAEKAAILKMYSDKIDEIITGYVEKIEPHYTLINIGRTSVVLQDKEKIGDEKFTIGQTVKVYLEAVGSSAESGITISRACPGFLKRLFEEEIRDVYDGTVIIKDIAREAGERAKISVTTNDINVDPVGACIGQGGSKIQKICNQINKEKIDVVQYHIHKGLFVAECLKPATVIGVKLISEYSAVAVVKDGDLRVAIGRKGVNARLAFKLANCKIDIKEESVARQEGIEFFTIDEMKKQEEEMIFEQRRKALLEQIAKEEEARKKREEEAKLAEENKAEEIEEKVETAPIEEKVEETPVEQVAEEVEEKVEETPVEYNPVNLQSKVSLADLEKQIEEEKKKKSNQTSNNTKKKAKVEEKVEPTTNKSRMDIYTQEELDAMDNELDEDEDYIDDEDIDYDDYDEYYDEK